MPIGANDYSRDWYSLDETPGDFAMEHFSIDRDREALDPLYQSGHGLQSGSEDLGLTVVSACMDEDQQSLRLPSCRTE